MLPLGLQARLDLDSGFAGSPSRRVTGKFSRTANQSLAVDDPRSERQNSSPTVETHGTAEAIQDSTRQSMQTQLTSRLDSARRNLMVEFNETAGLAGHPALLH